MIFDTLENIETYLGISANLDRAIEAIRNTDFSALAPGKYAVHGKQVYYMVQEPMLRNRNAAVWESHACYIDIQLALEDGEAIDYLPTSTIQNWESFDEPSDIRFSSDAQCGSPLALHAGCFMILFPQDAHMPCLQIGEKDAVKKVVLKVLV